MPIWLIDVLKTSPYLLVPVGCLYGAYRVLHRLVDSPLTIATIFGVLGGEDRRKDAKEIVELLCKNEEDDEKPAIEAPHPPARPPRRRRRHKRRR
jgi:hypothetical protein